MAIPGVELKSVLLMGVELKEIRLCLQSVYPVSNFYFNFSFYYFMLDKEYKKCIQTLFTTSFH